MNFSTIRSTYQTKINQREDDIKPYDINDAIKLLPQEYLLIWHDLNINSEENTNHAQTLRDLGDLRLFQDWQEASDCVKTIRLPCFVITCGTHGEDLAREISPVEDVISIMVFSPHKNKHKGWVENYPKVKGVKSTFENLYIVLQKRIAKFQRQKPSLVSEFLFSSSNTEDVHKHIKFKDRIKAKKDFMALVNKTYHDEEEVKEFKIDYNDYEPKAIVSWYMKRSFFYKTVKNSLSVCAPQLLRLCRLPLNDLETAVREAYKGTGESYSGLLYCNTRLTDRQWTDLQLSKGKDIKPSGFILTTKTKEDALALSNNDDDDSIKAVLVTIIIPNIPEKGEQSFAELKDLLDDDKDARVLFNLGSTFTIIEAFCSQSQGDPQYQVVLAYNLQALRKYCSQNNPRTKVPMKEETTCGECQKEVKLLESKYEYMFVNVTGRHQYICADCMNNKSKQRRPPHLCLASKVYQRNMKAGKKIIRVRGLIMEYKESPEIPFHGSICLKCHENQMQRCFRCIECPERNKIWCEKCFNGQNECMVAKHKVIMEDSPFTFWTEEDTVETNEDTKKVDQTPQDSARRAVFAEIPGNGDSIKNSTYNSKHDDSKMNSMNDSKKNTSEAYRELNKSLQNESSASKSSLNGKSVKDAKKRSDNNNLDLDISKEIDGSLNTPQMKSRQNSVKNDQTLLEGSSKNQDVSEDQSEIAAFKQQKSENSSMKVKSEENQIKLCSPEEVARQKQLNENLPVLHKLYESAIDFHKTGSFSKAEEQFIKAISLAETIFGEQTCEIAELKYRVGLLYYDSKAFENCIKYLRSYLETRCNVYAHNKSSISPAFSVYKHLMENLEDFDKATMFLSESLYLAETTHNMDPGEIAKFYYNYSLVCYDQDKYINEIENIATSSELVSRPYMPPYLRIPVSFQKLGKLYADAGNIDQAKEFFTEALDLCDESGWLYLKREDFSSATNFLLESLQLAKEAHGEQSLAAAKAHNNIGVIYHKVHDYIRAIQHFSASGEAMKSIHGHNFPIMAESLYNLGLVYDELGEFKSAIKYLQGALKIRISIYGEQDVTTALTYHALGLAHDAIGEFKEASTTLKKCKKVYLNAYGELDLRTATVFSNLGLIKHNSGEYRTALKYHYKAFELYIELLGDVNEDVGALYMNLGQTYLSMENYEAAYDKYSKSLDVHKCVFGPKHRKTVDSYYAIALTYYKRNEYSKALELYNLCSELYDESDPKMQKVYQSITLVTDDWEIYRNRMKLKKSILT